VGKRLVRSGAGDVDDDAPAAGHHARQHPLRELHHGDVVELDLRGQAGRVGFRDGAVRGEAGAVHQDVHGLAPFGDAAREGVGAAGLLQVGRDDLGLDGVARFELDRKVTQLVLAAGDQDEVRAAGGQVAGERGADAGRGAGHQGSLSGDVHRQKTQLDWVALAHPGWMGIHPG
jgi:hypothetical protein